VESPQDVDALDVQYPQSIGYVTQTTLSVDDTQAVIKALEQSFPAIEGPRHDDICYATQNRQDAVKTLSARVDLLLVVGSVNSSNSNRLKELAEKRGVPSYLIDGAEDIKDDWLQGIAVVGVTAGASAPESLVREVIHRLESLGGQSADELEGIPENMVFALPRELRLKTVSH
jgi:4-hydroxy-3-methylbut-2-enyl diphosphate reductase